FRGQHDALAMALHEFPEERFAVAVGVEVGGIDEVPPGLAERVVHLPRLVLGGPPAPFLAEGHRAERRLRNTKSTVAEQPVFHGSLLRRTRGGAIRRGPDGGNSGGTTPEGRLRR